MGRLLSLSVNFFKMLCRHPQLAILDDPVMGGGGGTGKIPHCPAHSSFGVKMGNVSRASAGGAFFRGSHDPLNK